MPVIGVVDTLVVKLVQVYDRGARDAVELIFITNMGCAHVMVYPLGELTVIVGTTVFEITATVCIVTQLLVLFVAIKE